MSLILVPASKENLEMSIEKTVDISFSRKYLGNAFVDEVLRSSGNEGIRCWAMTGKRVGLFNNIKVGDEVLFSEKRTGLFTHYGIVVGITQNVEFGNALWPVVGENPWENIYFLANIVKVAIDKAPLLLKLGYDEKFNLPGQIRLDEANYSKLGSVSKNYNIPIFNNTTTPVPEYNPTSDKTKPTRGHGMVVPDTEVEDSVISANICAICGIAEPELLRKSYLPVWHERDNNYSISEGQICFCSLHHQAFEYGYFGFDDDYKVIINPSLNQDSALFSELERFSSTIIKIHVDDRPRLQLIRKHRFTHDLD